MVSVPTSTNTIEITIATMGRLMKNFDITSPPLGSCCERFRVHHHSGTHLLHSFGDDDLRTVEAFGDDPVGAGEVADFHRANTDSVFGINHRDLIAALKL